MSTNTGMTHDEALAAFTVADQKTRSALPELVKWARRAPRSAGGVDSKMRELFVTFVADSFKGATRRIQSSLAIAKEGQPSATPEWLAREICDFECATARLIEAIAKKKAKK